MGEKLVQAGTALSGFAGVTLVVFGAFRVRYGVWTVEEALVLLFFAVAVVASYRSVAIHSGPRVNAIGNVALFSVAVAVYGVGVNFGIEPAMRAGQALFAIAVAYFLIRRY